MTALLLAISFLLCSIYTIIGFAKGNISFRQTIVLAVSWTVGVVCALLCITQLVVKITLWAMTDLPHLFMPNFF